MQRESLSLSLLSGIFNSLDLFTERCCQGDESPTSFGSQKHLRMVASHFRITEYAVSFHFLVISYLLCPFFTIWALWVSSQCPLSSSTKQFLGFLGGWSQGAMAASYIESD